MNKLTKTGNDAKHKAMREALKIALISNDGSVEKTAEMLKIHYTEMYRIIKKLGLRTFKNRLQLKTKIKKITDRFDIAGVSEDDTTRQASIKLNVSFQCVSQMRCKLRMLMEEIENDKD